MTTNDSNRLGIIVQRCHERVVGGSEALAWRYALLLKEHYAVDVLTTTAVDYSQWENVLPEGTEERDGVNIRRFKVTIGRSPHWEPLYRRLLADFNRRDLGRRRLFEPTRFADWTLGLQEEFIKHQGPYSEPLLKFLQQHWEDYRALLFITYLYPTSYFGLLQVPPRQALFAPTLHDEPTAYLPAYKHAARRARAILWLTHAEQRLGRDLWGEVPGHVVAADIDTQLRAPALSDAPYLLYCGRIDPNKGCAEMFDFFMRYKKQNESSLRLILVGQDAVPPPDHPDVEFRGFVSDEEKFRLMAGASVFLMPSKNESFSIVTLEAMAQRAPVLASGGSEVIVDHITQSGGGLIYNDYLSYEAALNRMLSNEGERRAMGALGRAYVTSRFSVNSVQSALVEAIESPVGSSVC